MKIDFTKLPVGTRVWDFVLGWGEIVGVNDEPGSLYPVCVDFLSGDGETYTRDGRYNTSDRGPRLFLNEFAVPEEAYAAPLPELPELPELAVDTPIMVRQDEGEVWRRRYFAEWDTRTKQPRVFADGMSSWTTDITAPPRFCKAPFKYWRLPTEEELKNTGEKHDE